jgi:tape measure domain-containing protein
MAGSGSAGSLWVKLGLSSKQFDTSLKKAENDLKKFGDRLNTLGMRITQSISLPLAAVGGASIKMAADMETAQVALTTLMGSVSAATKQMAQLKQFAASTPFQFTELLSATRRMMAFGFQAKETIPVLRNLGNASFALGQGAEGVNNMILALGQMRMKGRAQSEELTRQLGQYVGAWQYLANYLQVDVKTAMSMVEKRMIDGETAVKAVLLGIANDPKFKDGMAKQVKTLMGQWSNFKDQLAFTLADIGGLLVQTFDLKGVINNVRNAMKVFSDWFAKLDPGMRKLIAYGAAATAAFGPFLIILGKIVLGWSALIPIFGQTIGLIKGIGMAFVSMATGQAAAATAATGLAASLAPFLIGAAVIAGLVGIVALIKKFNNASKDAIKNYEKLSATQKSKKNVDNLAQAYGKLTDKINNTKPNSKEWKDLKEQQQGLMNQIAENYPSVVTAYDKIGNARKIDLDLLQQLIDKEDELDKKRLKKSRKQAKKAAQDALTLAKTNLSYYQKQLAISQKESTPEALQAKAAQMTNNKKSQQMYIKNMQEGYRAEQSRLAEQVRNAQKIQEKAQAQYDKVIGKKPKTTKNEYPFVCPICGEKFKTKVELEKHQKKIHGVGVDVPQLGGGESKAEKLSSVLSQWKTAAEESKAALLKNFDDIAKAERNAVNASAEKAQKDLERNYKELKDTKDFASASAKIEEDRKNKIIKINQDLSEQKKQIQNETNAELLRAQIAQANNENAIINKQQRYIAGGVKPEGMLEQGNLDLLNRPIIKNADKTISTVRSMTVAFDDLAVLLPTVRKGLDRIMTDREAIDWFIKTGEHLGKFSSELAANKYAEALHKQQEGLYTGNEKLDYLKNNYGEKFALELLEMQNAFEQNLEKYQKQGATKIDISNYTKAYKLQLAQKYKEYEEFVANTNALQMELDAQAFQEQGRYVEAAIKQEEAKWERIKATLNEGTDTYKLEYKKFLDAVATIQKDADEKLRAAQIESQKSKIDDQIQGLEYQKEEAGLLDDEVQSKKIIANLEKNINDLKIKRINIDISELQRQKNAEKDTTKQLEVQNEINALLRERSGFQFDNIIISSKPIKIDTSLHDSVKSSLSDAFREVYESKNIISGFESLGNALGDALRQKIFDRLADLTLNSMIGKSFEGWYGKTSKGVESFGAEQLAATSITTAGTTVAAALTTAGTTVAAAIRASVGLPVTGIGTTGIPSGIIGADGEIAGTGINLLSSQPGTNAKTNKATDFFKNNKFGKALGTAGNWAAGSAMGGMGTGAMLGSALGMIWGPVGSMIGGMVGGLFDSGGKKDSLSVTSSNAKMNIDFAEANFKTITLPASYQQIGKTSNTNSVAPIINVNVNVPGGINGDRELERRTKKIATAAASEVQKVTEKWSPYTVNGVNSSVLGGKQ